MANTSAESVDVQRARIIWEEYCREHDVSALRGKTAGIEPVSGRVWFGESGTEVHEKVLADGFDAPIYCIRVGYDYYVRKRTQAVIAGSITEDGIPFIAIKIGGGLRRAVIDTGFNGDLELPESLRGDVNAEFLFRATSLLAGGVMIDEDVFRVEFPFDGHNVGAEATFVDDQDILIGTKLLRNYRLTINFKSRTVRIRNLD